MEREIITALSEKGADLVRFVDLSGLAPEQTQGFPRAVLFCMVLSKQFIADMYHNPQNDGAEFLEKEQKTDDAAEWLAAYLQHRGYRAYAQSEKHNLQSGNFDEPTRTSVLPHKTIARLAGLGFIGKNNLLVTEAYGCAFSMCTVLTDAPIVTVKHPPVSSKCGECDSCKRICPAEAIHGNEWNETGGREHLVDVFKCYCVLKCMINCPWTLRYAGIKQLKHN